MKKVLTTISIITISFLICLVLKLNILDFSAFKSDELSIVGYNGYYFNKLQHDEKMIYVKIDQAVKDIKDKVYIGNTNNDNLSEKVNKVLMSYFYDNPELYYLSNEYVLFTTDLKIFTYSTIQLIYNINNYEEIHSKNKEMENVIQNILNSIIKDEMTDYEKELAIHDYLVKNVNYYKYKEIEDIPTIKHTAYGALVQKESVCDGYSKAFKILLDRVGIDSIIIVGSTEDTPHAWNVVNIQGENYHVDVTSDKLEDNKKHVIHAYFNVTDKQICKTHTINYNLDIPKCTSEKYNYYNKEKYYISNGDNLYDKLSTIILNQDNSNILEIKVDTKHTSKRIIDTLYDLDFNRWLSNRKESIEYTKIQDVYIFVK